MGPQWRSEGSRISIRAILSNVVKRTAVTSGTEASSIPWWATCLHRLHIGNSTKGHKASYATTLEALLARLNRIRKYVRCDGPPARV